MSLVSSVQTSLPWAQTCDEDIGSSRSVAASKVSIVAIVCSRSSRIAPRTVAAISLAPSIEYARAGGHVGVSHGSQTRIPGWSPVGQAREHVAEVARQAPPEPHARAREPPSDRSRRIEAPRDPLRPGFELGGRHARRFEHTVLL